MGVQLEPRVGSVMAYLGTSLLKAFEVIDLEERIGALDGTRGIIESPAHR